MVYMGLIIKGPPSQGASTIFPMIPRMPVTTQITSQVLGP